MIPTIITLSTIPPRFARLGPVLTALKAQDLPADEIRLNIPHSYRRFADWDGALPAVPDGVTIHRTETDLGPATKVLPAARDLRGQVVDLLFCDDDKIYDPGWHRRFKTEAAARPGCCIVEAGETFPDIADSHRAPDRLPRGRRRAKDWRYRLTRLASLMRAHPHLYTNSGYVDQISGYGGVMVRPDWFDDAAYDIPANMWMVDDPWLSGHLERAGIPIWLNGKGKRPGFADSGRLESLRDLVDRGADRVASDLAVIDHMRARYGIWQIGGPVDTDLRSMTASMRELARRQMRTA